MRDLLRAMLAIVVFTLAMGPALHAGAADTTVGQKVDDAAILSKVKSKLTTDRAKNLVHVNVDVKAGVVELKGSVPTEADKAEAERLARATDGVREVKNQLAITSPSASPSTK